MNDKTENSQTCCGSTENNSYSKKLECPICGNRSSKVTQKTILHNVLKPWDIELIEQGYYFCETENCDVVYFGQDSNVIKKSRLRMNVKENKATSILCYCFGVTYSEAMNQQVLEFVIEKTKEKKCDCEIRNPSGKCCLKNFPKAN